MQPEFDLVIPQSLHQALEMLQSSPAPARPLAGGTNLVVDMRSGRTISAALINISDLPELQEIQVSNGELMIGAAVTIASLQKNPLVRQHCQVLVQAADVFANPLIRNRATLGGNLADASPAADCAPPLLALDAEVELANISGCRRVSLADFFIGVRKNALQTGEILTAVYIPVPATGMSSAYYKIGLRKADAISVVSSAVSVKINDTRQVEHARIALGSVAPRPLRAVQAEACLRGYPLTAQTIKDASALAAREASPISDLRASADYRRKMVEVVVSRLLGQIKAQLKVQE